MKKLIIFALCLFCAKSLLAWGQKGHDVVAYIAECHLTPKAAEKVDKALGGHSLVYYANWLDNASHTAAFEYTRTWHYYNIDDGYTPETMPRNENGDVVSATKMLIDSLKNGGMTPDKENLCLRMLIHLVGDMHAPMHAGRLSDIGGNKVHVKMFKSPAVLHSVWDTAIIESTHKWSYSEWQQQIDRTDKAEQKEIIAGTPEDWFKESYVISRMIYNDSPENSTISYDYISKYAPIIENRLLRGGLRLAHILNEIYK